MESWVEIIKGVGSTTAVLLALGYTIWKGSQWIAREVIIPIRNGHLELLKRVGDSVENQAGSLETIAGSMSAVGSNRETETKRFDSIILKLSEMLTALENNVRKAEKVFITAESVAIRPDGKKNGGPNAPDPGR